MDLDRTRAGHRTVFPSWNGCKRLNDTKFAVESMCLQSDIFIPFTKTWCKIIPWILLTLCIFLTVTYRYAQIPSRTIEVVGKFPPKFLEKGALQNGTVFDNSSIFELEPQDFIPNLKNPCWWNSTDKQQLRCLPYFYLIGMPKCGTTDLYRRLISHPSVISFKKEPHWWTRLRYKDRHGVSVPFERYLNTFSLPSNVIRQALAGKQRLNRYNSANQIITVDASASTMWDNVGWERRPGNDPRTSEPDIIVAHRIRHIQPNAKFIAIFRDPVERLYSDFLFFGKDGLSPDLFHKYVVQAIGIFKKCTEHLSLRSCAYDSKFNMDDLPVRLRVGLYHIYVKDWFSVFPKKQMLFLQLENYHQNLRGNIEKIFKFLDLLPLHEDQMKIIIKQDIHNIRKESTVKLGDMWNETRQMLRQFYAPHNGELAQLLNNDAYLWWDA